MNAHTADSSASTSDAAAKLIKSWLQRRLEPASFNWLVERLEKHSVANSDRDLHITLGMIPRKLGKSELAPTAEEMAAAEQVCSGWDPSAWSLETASRLCVLCELAANDPATFGDKLSDLCRTADLAESITLFSGIPLYPASPALEYQIGQGLRTHIRAVFEAIAHRSPYPRTQFDHNRWNHMVLKALFIDSTLAPIQGLDERANPELASILCDYAHERWAADREVTPELWRCVGPYAQGSMIDDLTRVAKSPEPIQQRAAVLALCQSPDPAARALANELHPDLCEAVDLGTLTWQTL